MAGFGGYGKTESIDAPRADRMRDRQVRVLPAQPYMPPEPQKTAEVNIGSEYTEKGRLRPCVYGGLAGVPFVAQRGCVFMQLEAFEPLQLLIHGLIIA